MVKKTASKSVAPVTQNGPGSSSGDANAIVSPIEALQENILLIEASVAASNLSGLKRALRKNTFIRRYCSLDDFQVVLGLWLPKENNQRLYEDLELAMQTPLTGNVYGIMDGISDSEKYETAGASVREKYLAMGKHSSCSPETEIYLALFVLNALFIRKLYERTAASAAQLIEKKKNYAARPCLEILLAKIYYLRSHCAEHFNDAVGYRNEFLRAHRSACLNLNEFLQVSLINLILKSYCDDNLIEQAARFAAKANFPEHVSNNQQVRYLYYMGRIHGIQLDYSLAFSELSHALRKAPQHSAALGFRIAVVKLLSIVQLLIGELPERSHFSEPELEGPLQPYLSLVVAVRNGSLAEFHAVCKKHASVYSRDRLATLIVRLRHSVIRMGLRRINMSYSRISFSDVAKRLALDSPASAEFACAKAIRDGVIEASINHEEGHLISSGVRDVYSTAEPQQAFHKRVQFCLEVHNDAVRAMRFPPDAHRAEYSVPEEDDLMAESKNKSDEDIVDEADLDEEDEEEDQ